MPTFDAPEPISASISLHAGDIRLVASDRADTVVEVHPSDPDTDVDVEMARGTRAEYADGVLRVKTPRIRPIDLFRRSGSVDVTVELPAGSRVEASTGAGDVSSTGPLGECRVKTGAGHLELGATGPLRADTGAGNITVHGVTGDAEIGTSSGAIRVGRLDGSGTLKSSSGDLRIGELVQGSVTLRTAMGEVNIGVAEGTAAWLDVHTGYGRVRNSLAEGAAPGEEPTATAEVRAKTSYGDITIHRA